VVLVVLNGGLHVSREGEYGEKIEPEIVGISLEMIRALSGPWKANGD